ncbi:MAG: ribosome-associated translation inhibitor RaiA [Acidobacteria bacterium]|nr:ribosome-associated translation inhibitor RaiA [Acidobacteriota bacterium]
MRLELTGRHVTITPAVRKAVERRLARLGRMLNDSMHSVQVVITREKGRHRVELTLHARGEHFMHAAVVGRDLPTALTAAAEKLEHQAQKLKSRWTERKRQGVSAAKAASAAPRPERARGVFGNGAEGAAEPEPRAVRIIRARRYAVKPMSVDEAALEVGAGLEAFIVFRNASTDAINVLFRRADGHLGLIEPDA